MSLVLNRQRGKRAILQVHTFFVAQVDLHFEIYYVKIELTLIYRLQIKINLKCEQELKKLKNKYYY